MHKQKTFYKSRASCYTVIVRIHKEGGVLMRYDVAIIGAGTAGIFAAYELLNQKPGLNIVVLESGTDIYRRQCPIVAGRVRECIS